MSLVQTFLKQGQTFNQLRVHGSIPFPVIDYRPAALGQHRTTGLDFPRVPSSALQCVVTAATIVLDVGLRRAQLRIPLLEPVELGANIGQVA